MVEGGPVLTAKISLARLILATKVVWGLRPVLANFSTKIITARSILGGMTGVGVTLLYVCMHAVFDSQTLC